MSEDKPPTASRGEPGRDPGGADDDVLRRAAREIRASRALEALVPLAASERERLADAAIERVLGMVDAPALSSAPVPSSEPAPEVPSAVASAVRPRFAARSVGIVVATTLALAAAVVLVVRSGRRSVEPLAAYAMTVEGEQHLRGSAEPSGSPGEPVTLRPETRLVVTLVPRKPSRDALLRMVLVRNRRATLLDPPIAGTAGKIVVEGSAAELLGAQSDGPGELVLVLGRELPGDDEIRGLALGGSAEPPNHLQVLRRAVILDGFSHTAVDALLGGCGAVLEVPGAVGKVPRCEVAAGARIHLWVRL